jgi:hypothetical protein
MSEFFKEYTHIVADPTKTWPYFDIPGCLKRLPWSVDECDGRITPQWMTEDGLTRHAVVQLALYTCPPFRDIPPAGYPRTDATEGYIIAQDPLKNNDQKPRKYLCRDVRSLVEALATALMHYESWCEYVYGWPQFQDERERAVSFLSNVQAIMSALRQKGSKRKDPTLKNKRKLEDEIDKTINISNAITYQDYQRAGAPTDTPGDPRAHGNKHYLLTKMQEAFRTYMPENWSDMATYRALAAIMNQMQIKNADGRDWKPNSIKQLLKRGPHPRLTWSIHLTHPNVEPWYTRPE